MNLNEKIDLEYYKLVKTGEGAITLEGSKEGFRPIKGEGGAGAAEEYAALSDIIAGINEHFRTSFDPADKVTPLRQIRDSLTRDPRIVSLAESGDEKTLRMVYDTEFPDKVAGIYESNNEFFDRLLSDKNFLNAVKDNMWRIVLQALNKHAA